MTIKKTRIVATIGPASADQKTIAKMIKSGVNLFRLNFSHGDHKSHQKNVNHIRSAAKKLGATIAIIQDLSGPKIRIGDFYAEKVNLKKGKFITLTTKPCLGDESKVFVSYKTLPKEVKKGSIILLDDGKKKLEVISITKNEIKCKIIIGGETKGRRGVNIPGAYLKISSLTDKDKKDLNFGATQDVDYIALSFVRKASDIKELRKFLKNKKSDTGIIAKIETKEAIENLDEIIKEADAVMVARGDLAVEMPPEDVPYLQKVIIKKCNKLGKPVIVATQMLESMIKSPVPTRAEVSDIANSILDGADAVMLSEETALGENPVEVVAMMRKVALQTEKNYPKINIIANEQNTKSTIDAISESAVETARDVQAKAIIALTETGLTARMISRFKPSQPIIVMTPSQKTANKVVLSFGTHPVIIKPFKYVADVLDEVKKFATKNRFAKKGDKVLIAAGVPFGHVGGTNMIMVQKI